MQNETQQTTAAEVSLKDMVGFFKCNGRLIVFCGIAGLLFSTAYVLLAPKKYEARWHIQMAEFINSNIEEPAALTHRLRLLTAYPVEVQQTCGLPMPENEEFDDYLDGKLKIEVVRNIANVVNMKVVAHSMDHAMKCAEAVSAMIIAQQRSLIEERLAGRKEQLLQYQQALREEKHQLDKIKKSELGNFAYLTKLDKLSWLRTRIDALQEEALLAQLHPAKLLAPVYVPNKPVSPKVGLMLLLGMTLGLILSVLYALGRKAT